MPDPTEQHAAYLAALDRLEGRIDEMEQWADSTANTGDAMTVSSVIDYLGGPSSLKAALAGRRSILVRHAPVLCSQCPESRQHFVSAAQPMAEWPSPDYRDAAAGLPEAGE